MKNFSVFRDIIITWRCYGFPPSLPAASLLDGDSSFHSLITKSMEPKQSGVLKGEICDDDMELDQKYLFYRDRVEYVGYSVTTSYNCSHC